MFVIFKKFNDVYVTNFKTLNKKWLFLLKNITSMFTTQNIYRFDIKLLKVISSDIMVKLKKIKQKRNWKGTSKTRDELTSS